MYTLKGTSSNLIIKSNSLYPYSLTGFERKFRME